MQTREVTITEDQIVINRQALLDVIVALDISARIDRVPAALDVLREPFFPDEIGSGQARKDFSVNNYEHPIDPPVEIAAMQFDFAAEDAEIGRIVRGIDRADRMHRARPSNDHPRSFRKQR